MAEYLQNAPLSAAIKMCRECSARAKCKAPVPGLGPRDARVVLIARSPSTYDDKARKPLGGSFGAMMGECMARMGVNIKKAGFIHTVSCANPDNEDPTYEQITACAKWREKQLTWFHQKRIVIAWGRPAINAVYGGVERMTDVVAQLHKPVYYPGRDRMEAWGVIPLWHPVYMMKDKEKKVIFRNELAPRVKEIIEEVLRNGVPWHSDEEQGELFS